MSHPTRSRWLLFGATLGALSTLALVVGLGVVAGTGTAASGAPANTAVPTIQGKAEKGSKLHANPGSWSGTTPITYNYQWQRCGANGSGCAAISGATAQDYTLVSADVGNTVRVVVTAKNSTGTASAASAPTAQIAAPQAPAASAPPTISGTPAIGQTLTANPGTWTGPGTISISYQWLRCDPNGGGCSTIADAIKNTYALTSADVGHALRVKVTAKNDNGTTSATSVPTAAIASTAGGCAIGAHGPVAASDVNAPARLSVDQMQFTPSVLTRNTTQVVARFYVSACGGRPVQGALVYATAVPFNQLDVPPEVTTDGTGWATVSFHTLRGFPAARHQQLLAMFVRARKPGGDLLGGVSTRRLVSTSVDLRR